VRVFLDTNVLVSAFAARGLCVDLFELVLADHELVTGEHVLRELERALRRKLRLPQSRVGEILDFVADQATEIVSGTKAASAAVDQADALVLGEALAVRADAFVTGDAALLKLSRLRGMPVLSPRQFWEVLRRG
jgi:putative PIN family toxin of toxin-antitoxin system